MTGGTLNTAAGKRSTRIGWYDGGGSGIGHVNMTNGADWNVTGGNFLVGYGNFGYLNMDSSIMDFSSGSQLSVGYSYDASNSGQGLVTMTDSQMNFTAGKLCVGGPADRRRSASWTCTALRP